MVMTGASSVANYQDLLRTVGFHSTSDNPTNFGADAIRILTWTVSDGDGDHDHDDDTRYPGRERCPAGDGCRNRGLYGERGAGRALAGRQP